MHVKFDETNHLDQDKGIDNDVGLEYNLYEEKANVQ